MRGSAPMLSAPSDRKAAVACASVGLFGLGLLSLVFHDLLLQWQPAPHDASWRGPLALVSGVILVAAGAGLWIPRARRLAASLGCAWFALWVLVLNVPVAITARFSVISLLGVAEISAMALGLGVLALPPDARRYKRVLVAAFGVCAVIFGLSHFVYAEFTATMVPNWMPNQLAIAYVTGAVHALAGLALLTGLFAPVAAWIETAMMSSFVLLLHLPRVMDKPGDRVELTMLFVAITLTSAAWIVAASTRDGLHPRST